MAINYKESKLLTLKVVFLISLFMVASCSSKKALEKEKKEVVQYFKSIHVPVQNNLHYLIVPSYSCPTCVEKVLKTLDQYKIFVNVILIDKSKKDVKSLSDKYPGLNFYSDPLGKFYNKKYNRINNLASFQKMVYFKLQSKSLHALKLITVKNVNKVLFQIINE